MVVWCKSDYYEKSYEIKRLRGGVIRPPLVRIGLRSGLILNPIGLIAALFFLAFWVVNSEVWKRQLKTGFCGVEPNFVAYCRVSCFLLNSKRKVFISTCRLVSDDVLKAPVV